MTVMQERTKEKNVRNEKMKGEIATGGPGTLEEK